jgi:hypothetical protein
MSDGLGDALARFNSSQGPGEVDDKTEGADTGKGSKSATKGHHYAVHVHKDGTHHLTVHHGGQLVHHSEHEDMEGAAHAMMSHAGGKAHEGGTESETSVEG